MGEEIVELISLNVSICSNPLNGLNGSSSGVWILLSSSSSSSSLTGILDIMGSIRPKDPNKYVHSNLSIYKI